MPSLVTNELFIRYTQGRTSQSDADAVEAWLTEPANRLLVQQRMGQHWDALADGPVPEATSSGPNYDALLDRLHERLFFDVLSPLPSTTPIWWRLGVAATVAGILAGGGWLLRPAQPASAPAAPLKYTTAYGQVRTVQLPDGSQVTLNGHSDLRYAAGWAPQQPREVWLDGEGYFAVQHRPNNQPFVVHTRAGFSVEVLGTRFTVNRRRDQAHVVLLSGSVRVDFDNPHQADVILKPGEMLETHDARPALLVHKAVRTEPYAAWKDAKLVLDETTIAELATRLQDTYGIQVTVTPARLNQRKMTGTVPVRSLNVLLLALQEAFHLKTTRQGNSIVLSEK